VAGEVRIGTSGWVYPHWRETFYPKGLPQSRWLEHCAEQSVTGNRSERRSNAGDGPYPTTSPTP
jgi:hypothetical protein